MADPLKYLINQFHLQTRLFNNVTVGISDADSINPMNRNTNPIAWMIGHSVSTRYQLANVLGIQVQEPFPDLFSNQKGMDKSAEYPSVKELTRDWNSISESLENTLHAVSEEALAEKMPRPVPTGDTLGDFVSFIIHHEAYTLGQLGIYRRFHGMEPMKYT
jgi:DinB family protein